MRSNHTQCTIARRGNSDRSKGEMDGGAFPIKTCVAIDIISSLRREDGKRPVMYTSVNTGTSISRRLFPATISRTIALALAILALLSIMGVLAVRLARLFLAVSVSREGVPGNAAISRRNFSLVRPRIIARVNGSFFSMLRPMCIRSIPQAHDDRVGIHVCTLRAMTRFLSIYGGIFYRD